VREDLAHDLAVGELPVAFLMRVVLEVLDGNLPMRARLLLVAAPALLVACTTPPKPSVNRVPIAITVPGEGDAVGGMVVPVAHEGHVRYLALDRAPRSLSSTLATTGPSTARAPDPSASASSP
jgi:hypothetical protein